MPPKPPFERTATRSPGRSPWARSRTISSTVGTNAASVPSRRMPATSSASESRWPSGTLPGQVRRRDDHAVRAGERPGEAVLERAGLGRVGPRLEDGHETPVLPQGPQGGQGGGHGGRVVGEVVVDRDASRLPAHLQPALDAPEGGERRPRQRGLDPGLGRRREGRQRVADVVLPPHRQGELPLVPPVTHQPEAGPPWPGRDLGRAPVGALVQPEGLDPAARAIQDLHEGRALGSGDEQPVAGDDVHQAHERDLDGGEVRVDVRVVELDVADDRHVREVVDELRPLVEEGTVVLVTLDHEVRATAQPVAAPEVHRHPADQEGGVEPGLVEKEGEEAGRRGLPVRARHDQRGARPQELLGQEAGQAGVPLPAVEHRLHLGIPPGEGVADDHEVGVLGHVGLGPGRPDGDAEGLELRGHRRVHVLVGARHLVALLAQQPGQGSHRRAADGRQVDLHSTGASSTVKRASPPAALETGPHAEGQRHVRVGRVAARQAQGHRHVDPGERLEQDILERIVLLECRGAALHVPEDDSGHPLERARGPQLPQHPIDPVGLLVHVLHEQERGLFLAAQRPRSAGRRGQ